MSPRDIRDCIKVLLVLNLLFWCGSVLASCEEPSALPAPRSLQSYVDQHKAKSTWKWYAAAWTIDTATTHVALNVNTEAREGNPVFGDRPILVAAAKAAVGFGAWRVEVHFAKTGSPWVGKLIRWVFVVSSLAAGTWNMTVAF